MSSPDRCEEFAGQPETVGSIHEREMTLRWLNKSNHEREDPTMSEERLLVDTVLDMTAASVERAGLDGRELMMVRMAATLAAVGAPTGSYLLNIAAAAETEMTIEDARSVLIAVALDHRFAEGHGRGRHDRRCPRHRPRPRVRGARGQRRRRLSVPQAHRTRCCPHRRTAIPLITPQHTRTTHTHCEYQRAGRVRSAKVGVGDSA